MEQLKREYMAMYKALKEIQLLMNGGNLIVHDPIGTVNTSYTVKLVVTVANAIALVESGSLIENEEDAKAKTFGTDR
jgi:hypothetical protein